MVLEGLVTEGVMVVEVAIKASIDGGGDGVGGVECVQAVTESY